MQYRFQITLFITLFFIIQVFQLSATSVSTKIPKDSTTKSIKLPIRNTAFQPLKLNFWQRIALKHLQKKALKINKSEPKRSYHWGAIASFVSAIVSLFFATLIFGLLAVIFGAIALPHVGKKMYNKGKAFALIGIIIGCIAAFIGAMLVF
jgi:Domain of unknown function (DUF4190)